MSWAVNEHKGRVQPATSRAAIENDYWPSSDSKSLLFGERTQLEFNKPKAAFLVVYFIFKPDQTKTMPKNPTYTYSALFVSSFTLSSFFWLRTRGG